ncbi:kinesin-related protein 4 [Diachasma alloeum]|uniref:kinesin-related protein 4 n=1 Tax=Diachasma alloeum TaxID=454923 RepID=UPI00073828D3|nr:kinesin-related protein 4 [Diachasma alloeum]
MSDNIKVAIKVRPLIKREKKDNLPVQWAIDNNKIAQFDVETKKRGETEYTFDYIFDQNSTNEDVFKATVQPVVEAAMRGFNGTIFAYGQTSSGKTYTMMGTKEEPGVIPLAVNAIFDCIMKDETREFVLSVSYIELYNEKVNDLLDTKNQDLKLREDNGEVRMDCKEEVAHSVEDILRAMKRGEKNRSIGETNMNEKSSRSHTIFRITIGSVLRSDPDGDATVAQLNLIDLAGSERAKETGATGDRFKEGKHINLSLSTLGLVINQLSESQVKGKGQKVVGHISYRDSKLTRILQSSLGGNSLTTIICAVTPAAGDETSCTLAFAQRAKGIKNKPKVNETGSDEALVKKFRKQIHKLEENLKNMSKQLREKEEKLQDIEVLKGRIELLKTKILSGEGPRSEGRKSKSQFTRRRTWGGSGTSPADSPISFQLPTIPESDSHSEDPEEKKQYIKRRQSVFRNVKMVADDESFSTNWEDFELQLIKDEEEKMARWSCESTDLIQDPREIDVRRVRFMEEPESVHPVNSANAECPTTPEKSKCPDSSSPETPKTHLRHQITNLCVEYNQLRSYTTLEKQLRQEEPTPQEPMLEFIQKSLLDSEQVCRDINKKYSELKSEHSILKSEHQESLAQCETLRKTIESLTSANEQLPTLESERNFFKAKFTETTNKLKILEDETSSHAYAMELLINKHKLREKELEKSLDSAWEELKAVKDGQSQSIDNKNDNNDSLKILINDLTNKLASADEKIEGITNENKELKERQNMLILRAEEDVKNYKEIVDDLNEKIENLEMTVKTKDNEISDLQKSISALTETHEKMLLEKSGELSAVTETLEKEIKHLQTENEALKLELTQKSRKVSSPGAPENPLESSPAAKTRIPPLESSKLPSELEETKLKPQGNVTTTEKTLLEDSIISNTSFFNSFALEKSLAPTDSVFTNETMSVTANTTISTSLIDPEQSLLQESLLQSLTSKSPEQLVSVINTLDKENRRLMKEFQQKALESEEIKNYISTFKADVEKLRETVIILTNENAELTMKLEHEKDHSDEIKRSFEKQMTNVLEEKRNLETLNKSMNNSGINLMNFSVSPGDDLQVKIDSLIAENTQLSSDFMEKLEELEEIKRNLEAQKKRCETFEKENEDLSNNLMEKIEEYEGIIKGLKDELLVKSDHCKKCGHLAELIQTRRALKQEVKSADKKLEDLKEDFERKSASIEKLQEKAKENVNISGLLDDTMFNGSILEAPEGVDTVSYVEEKVQKLHSELEGLRTNYDSLTILYNQKCQEIETLSDKKIDKVREEVQRHRDDLQKFKKCINNVSNALEKFKDEKSLVEGEMEALREENKRLMERVREEERIALESRAAGEAMETLQGTVDTLTKDLRNSRDENGRLVDEISSLKSQMTVRDVSPGLQELEEVKEFLKGEMSQQFEESSKIIDLVRVLISIKNDEIILQVSKNFAEELETLQESVKALTEDLQNSKQQNSRLIEEISSLKSQTNDQDISPGLQELEEAKSYLMREMSQDFEESVKMMDLIKLFVSTKTHEEKLLQDSKSSGKELETLQKSVKALTDDLQHSKKENSRLIEEIPSLKSQTNDQDISPGLQELEEAKSYLRREMFQDFEESAKMMDLIKLFVSTKTHEEKLLQDSKSSGEELETLQKSVKALTEDLQRSKEENSRLIEEISSLKSRTNDHDISPGLQELQEAKYYLMRELSQDVDESAKMIDLIKLFISTKTHEEKILQDSNSSGEQLENLQKSVKALTEDLQHSQKENSRLIEEISSLKSQTNDHDISPGLQELEEAKSYLMRELSQDVEESAKMMDLIKLFISRKTHEEKILQDSKSSGEELENLQKSVKALTADLQNFKEENNRLMEEISSVKSQTNDQDISPGIQELEEAKSYLKKEICSLQSSQKFDESPLIADLIKLFISTIMAKESEIIQKIQSSHKREKLKLEEEKKQLVDAEKRSILWAKELESDVERLQQDFSTQESKKSSLEEEISRLKNLLKELQHEKNLLDEKVRVMETDYVTLQSDLEKYSKRSFSEESKSLSLEEHDKILHELLMNKDIEHSSKVHQLEQGHRMKVEELENSLECLKTKNMELRRNIEGLEANKENYQAIIDLKAIELEKSVGTIDRLEKELEEATAACDNLRGINDEHLAKVEEVTQLLKVKCDKLSEMKNQIQGMTPEYERLKDESLENQSRLEKYKTEIEFLRGENIKQRAMLGEVQDALKTQEIKSVGLEKQLAESRNLNEVVQGKLRDMGERIEGLRTENETLVRKIRNSTSKLTAERDLEDLRDENAGLKKSLEGASNRILELQTQKSQLLSEITDLKSVLDTQKSQLQVLQSENKKLGKENKELDDEMELMLQRIRELEDDNVKMERKYWDLKEETASQAPPQGPEYNILKEKYDKLSKDFECQSMTCDLLTKENAELKVKVNSEGLSHSRSNSSSRSASPTPGVSMRRKRRSDLFNQNRPQELAQEFVVTEERECNCESFRKTILNLEHELVLKKGKITALEMKIEGLCIPYKKRCQDYQETLGLAKQNIQQLQKEVNRLREEQGKASNCEKCKFWRNNRRDAETQCIPEVMTGFMAPKSGIIQDQVMINKKIEKLEKEKGILKGLCISRRSEIHVLEKKVKELELQLQSCETRSGDSLQSNGNISEESKENVPSNIMDIMGQSKSSSSRSYRLNQ